MKTHDTMKDIEAEGLRAFTDTLARVPGLRVDARTEVVEKAAIRFYEADFIADVSHGQATTRFVGEVKSNGQPRNAIAAIAQLKAYIAELNPTAQPVFIAPFLSKETRTICEEQGVNYLDLAGNVRIAFDGVYIEREAAGNPFKEKREFRTLFSPKSGQVLKTLLRDPERRWRMAELADAAQVSLGLVSNVKTALTDQDWVRTDENGFGLSKPGQLLDEWRDQYRGVGGSVLQFYTTLHGTRLNDTVRDLMKGFDKPHAALASYTAAEWYTPYTRVGLDLFYADQQGLDRLTEALKLSPAMKGGNVTVTYLHYDMPVVDAERRGPDLWCTSAVQTYLDLWISGERGREAADFLRKECLSW